MKDSILIEQATEDIKLTQMITDTSSETRKSILYMPQWPDVIEQGKILFIPK